MTAIEIIKEHIEKWEMHMRWLNNHRYAEDILYELRQILKQIKEQENEH